MHSGSSVESGFELGILRPRSQALTIWPPRPEQAFRISTDIGRLG
ncbi:hypothetical protein AVEN_158792-1, partial [Araneus ventricosus]